MLELLLKIIPLDLAATLSPGILALAVILLSGKIHPVIRTISFFIGTLIVAVAIALIGFYLGKSVPVDVKQSLLSAVVDLVLGILFILFALKTFFNKDRQISAKTNNQSAQVLKWMAVGFVVSATNFDALFLSLTAAKEVGGTTAIGDINKFILLIVNIFFFTLPILLPLAIYLLLPDLAGRILARINHFVLKYSRNLVVVLFLIFGIVLIIRGIKFWL